MSDNNSGGCLAVALVMAVGVVLAGFAIGGPNIAAIGLSWDSSAAIARTNARVEMNLQDNITRRRDSDNWHATAQQVAMVAGAVGVVLAVGWAAQRSVTAWAARPHRSAAPPATIVMLAAPTLAAAPEARLEWSEEDGAWVIVNDRTQTIKLLENRRQG